MRISLSFSVIFSILFSYIQTCAKLSSWITLLHHTHTSHLRSYSGEWILGKQLQVHLVAHGHIQGICRNGRWNISGLFNLIPPVVYVFVQWRWSFTNPQFSQQLPNGQLAPVHVRVHIMCEPLAGQVCVCAWCDQYSYVLVSTFDDGFQYSSFSIRHINTAIPITARIQP